MMTPQRWSRRLILCSLLSLTWGVALGATTSPDFQATGTWTWSWKDSQGQTHVHTLEVEGAEGKLAARERFDDLEPVTINDLTIEGDTLNFSVLRGDQTTFYQGKFADANTINGQGRVMNGNLVQEFSWTAHRESDPE